MRVGRENHLRARVFDYPPRPPSGHRRSGRVFAKLGRWCFRNRGKVALLWLAALIVFGGVSGMVGTAYSTEFALPDVESRRGFDILDEHFADSGAGGEGGTIVFRAEQGVADPEVQQAMTAYFEEACQIEGITIVSPYTEEGAQQIASQGPEAGKIAYAQIGLPREITLEEATVIGAELGELMPEIPACRSRSAERCSPSSRCRARSCWASPSPSSC